MAVFGLVSSVAGFVKVRYLVDKAVIDNMVFRFHYRITSALLFASCIILTANNLIGLYTPEELHVHKMHRLQLSRPTFGLQVILSTVSTMVLCLTT